LEMIPLRYRWGGRTFKLHSTFMSYIY
jgi:hypothetical protein